MHRTVAVLGLAIAGLAVQPLAAQSSGVGSNWPYAKVLYDLGQDKRAERMRDGDPLPEERAQCYGAWSAWNSALEKLDLSEADKTTLGEDLAENSNMIAVTWFNAAFNNREAEPLIDQGLADGTARLTKALDGSQTEFTAHFFLLGLCGGGLGLPVK